MNVDDMVLKALRQKLLIEEVFEEYASASCRELGEQACGTPACVCKLTDNGKDVA